jgi:hypothetical protein
MSGSVFVQWVQPLVQVGRPSLLLHCLLLDQRHQCCNFETEVKGKAA